MRIAGATIWNEVVGYAMRFALAVWLSLGFMLAPGIARAAPPQSQTCQFVQGFKALHDLIPQIVGDCLLDQHYDAQTGDALQETTTGLLVWRKADNWTAFTNGYRTWMNGPYGLQQRLNTERFPWETADESCLIAPAEIPSSQVEQVDGGPVTVRATATNACDQPINALVDVFAENRDGSPAMDSPTVYLRSVSSKQVRDFSVTVPVDAPRGDHRFVARTVWFYDVAASEECVDVGTTRCLSVDAWLLDAVNELRRLPEGEWMLRVAAESGTRIRFGPVGDNALASYDEVGNTITLASYLDAYSAWVRATVLAHELQHAADAAAGRLGPTPEDCYRAEANAFRRESQVWGDFWQHRLPPDVDRMHQVENDISAYIVRDPTGFVEMVRDLYKDQCEP